MEISEEQVERIVEALESIARSLIWIIVGIFMIAVGTCASIK